MSRTNDGGRPPLVGALDGRAPSVVTRTDMVGPTTRIEDALTHVKNLFLEAPRLSFSTTQASRMTGIDEETCLLLLLALLDRRFLERAGNGAFVLRVDRRVPEV